MSNPDRTVVNERYEIHERIGRGGMADVFLARDLLLDRPVAIKVLFPEFATDPAFVERFRREAQAAANLNHPNIVAVYDWGRAGTTYFMAMEYVQGRTLAEMLHARSRLTADQAADVAMEVASALSFAHQNGVVHRDVKPANILIANNGQVKVADFGIARAIDSGADNLTQTGAVMGTATYFSPEQAQGAQPDPRSDLYSLGIVLYELVSGQPPFIGDSQVAIAYKQVHEAPRPLNHSVPEIPRQFEAIVAKCLAKNPNVRYDTATALRDDLRRFKEGQPVHAWQQAVGNTGQTPVTAMIPTIANPQVQNNMATTAVPRQGPATQVMPQQSGGGDWPPYEDEAPRSPYFYFFSALLAVAVIVGAVFLVINATKNDSSGGPLKVPELISETYTKAAQELIDMGLVPVPDPVKSETVDPGVVYAQNPLPGVILRKGDSVTLTYNPEGAPVQVPDISGMTITEATQALAAQELRLQISETRIDPSTPINQIISQTPLANETVPAGSTILVIVSGGAGDVQVPDVSGQTSAAAQQLLQATPFQFIVSVETEASGTVPAGQVIRTDPSGGSAAVSGDKITIFVSAGPDRVSVPDVRNMSQAEAEAALTNANLEFSVQNTQLPAGNPGIGKVVDQGTDPGTLVDPDTTIKIYIGVKAPTPTTTSTSTTLPTPP